LKVVVADTETDGLDQDYTKMWIFGGKELDTGNVVRFEPFRGKSEVDKAIKWVDTVDLWVGHNFIAFDLKAIDTFIKPKLIDPQKVVDTLVLSRLVHYGRLGKNPHSLDTWGQRLGRPKLKFSDFSNYSEEMVTYWEQDLDTNVALYEHLKKYLDDPSWQRSIRIEHDTQIELERQRFYGFYFDKPAAEDLLVRVKDQMQILEDEIAKDYPPQMDKVHEVKYRVKEDGAEYATVTKTKAKYPITKVDKGMLVCYNYVSFNPGSPKQRIDKLWEAGWKPVEKTKTHQQFARKKVGDTYGTVGKVLTKELYSEKKADFERYGWAVNEDNLNTLPKNAPAGARKLAQWLTLEGRRSSLVEWIGQCKADSRIHGRVLHIGAWTGRAAHKKPNTANISSAWHGGEPKTAVEVVKAEFDTSMRSLWCVPNGSWLVGVDADGIQLRILADYLWRHYDKSEYAEAIVKGKKEDETDIHNVNRRALKLEHITRDTAKTFVYAWVLNAGEPKIASILQTKVNVAKSAKEQFENSIPGLKPFKSQFLPQVAKQKYFTGYDGRKVIVPNLHKVLAGILQNGEAVLMKWAIRKAQQELRGTGIKYKQVAFVHDETQTEVKGTREEAEHVKEVQIDSIKWAGKELGFKIPTLGSGSVGLNWADSH